MQYVLDYYQYVLVGICFYYIIKIFVFIELVIMNFCLS